MQIVCIGEAEGATILGDRLGMIATEGTIGLLGLELNEMLV